MFAMPSTRAWATLSGSIRLFRMWRNLRIALMWLLAFAVPAQGFAAASMSNCGPGHHGAAGAHTRAGHSGDHAHGTATPPHSHEGVASHHSHPSELALSSVDGDGVAEVTTAGKVAKGSCSACASCCTAAALPTSVLSFEATPVHDGVAALVPRSMAPFLTDGPDRPPRSLLA